MNYSVHRQRSYFEHIGKCNIREKKYTFKEKYCQSDVDYIQFNRQNFPRTKLQFYGRNEWHFARAKRLQHCKLG